MIKGDLSFIKHLLYIYLLFIYFIDDIENLPFRELNTPRYICIFILRYLCVII
jgi:hypothetical protein